MTKTKAAHTRGFWKVGTGWIFAEMPGGARHDTTVHFAETGPGPANAEFIVRACNAHEDLLEAAQEALRLAFKHETQYWKDAQGTDAEKLGKIVSIMRAAIAKAEKMEDSNV